MPKPRRKPDRRPHEFRNKLLLNQWLISLFGIDPLADNGERPFHILSGPVKEHEKEGLDADNLHYFYHYLGDSPLFSDTQPGALLPGFKLNRATLLAYEENIVRHTQAINRKRIRPVVWKYYQWLTLLFIEIYLDRFFNNPEGLLADLNAYTDRFNDRWEKEGYERLARYDGNDKQKRNPLPFFAEDDLNKLCLQSATGSGKTLLMHVNLLQYSHYAEKRGRVNDLSRVILLTPNERLSEQHVRNFWRAALKPHRICRAGEVFFRRQPDFIVWMYWKSPNWPTRKVPTPLATRSLGDQNLLLVDEGHRG